MHFSKNLHDRILEHLAYLYGAEQATVVWQRLEAILYGFCQQSPSLASARAGWPLTQRDAILITYGDQFQEVDAPPLQTLHKVLNDTLGRPVSGVHILPFFPYSSDDGFSVIDYTRVDPALGTWRDVERLGADYRLMFDLVTNHVSKESHWFQRFQAGDPAFADWFITVEPGTDLSMVVRPRALPLLTPVQTRTGEKLVWTTFSDDQMDLNFAHAPVLLRMLEILLFYVQKGARVIRLDAIAYLWKEIGNASIHMEETHRVVKLIRAVLDAVAPSVVLITETNVPHEENITYFGSVIPGTDRTDEAQLVYQFPLAPLLMHAIRSGDASALSRWAATLRKPARRTAFFNFTASHDGIGLMPARGVLDTGEIQALVDTTLAHGGRVSFKANPDGSRSVYELNISYFDALSDPAGGEPLSLQAARFLASQAIMLALAGVPGIYVHSLLGSRSWQEGVALTGHNRTINRAKINRLDLEGALADPSSLRSQVLTGYRDLLSARASSPAFHPLGEQRVLFLKESVFALLRISPDGQGQVLGLHSVSDRAQSVDVRLGDLDWPSGLWRNLLTGEGYAVDQGVLAVRLEPYEVCWLEAAAQAL